MPGYEDYYLKITPHASSDLSKIAVQAFEKVGDVPVENAVYEMDGETFINSTPGQKVTYLKKALSSRPILEAQFIDVKFYVGNAIQVALQDLMNACYNTYWLSSDHEDVDNREGNDPGGDYVRAFIGIDDGEGVYLSPDASDKSHAGTFVGWLSGLTAQELTALYGD